MKIIIFNNLFNYYNSIPLFTQKKYFAPYYKAYNITRLKCLIKKLSDKYNEKIEFKIYNSGIEKFNINDEINVELVADYRINLDREKYSKILEKVIEKTKSILIQFFNNLFQVKELHIKGVSIGKLIEFEIISYFNEILKEYELLLKILETEDYDKAIFFNYNFKFLEFLKPLTVKFKNITIYQDSILNFLNKRLKWYFFNYIFHILKSSFKGIFSRKAPHLIYKHHNQKKNDNILFFGYKEKKLKGSIFQSIKPLHDYLKQNNIFNPLYYYHLRRFVSIKEFNEILKILFQFKKLWKKNQEKILKNLKYESIKLNEAINYYFDLNIKFYLIVVIIEFFHFIQFIKYYPPAIIVSTNYSGMIERFFLRYSLINNIPTVYIPLAANLIFPEVSMKTDFRFITVSGERNKKYFIDKGEPEEKIIVTGRPRYEFFYKENIKALSEIKDINSNRIFKFDKNKFPILFITNFQNLDAKSRELLITYVINSLQQLNLIDNLIIKLHPLEEGTAIKLILQKLNVNPIIIKHYNIFEIIKSCKLVLARSSTTILESMIIGTPVIVLDLINLDIRFSRKYQVGEEKSLISVKNQKMLTENLKKLIEDSDFYDRYSIILKDLAKKYSFYNENERPIEKIVDLFTKLINSKEK